MSQVEIVKEESVTRRKNHGKICHKKKKITEVSVTRRKNHGKIFHKKIKSWKNMSQKEKIMG